MMSPEQQHLREDLHELVGKTLGCCEVPEVNHGDILKVMVEDELWKK